MFVQNYILVSKRNKFCRRCMVVLYPEFVHPRIFCSVEFRSEHWESALNIDEDTEMDTDGYSSHG